MTKKVKDDRFLKADRDCPCEKCDKVRKTCRHCEKCKECCDCPICYHCGGAQVLQYSAADWFVKEVGYQCYCEPCKGCGKLIDSQNPYGIDDNNDIWCDKCGPKQFKE